MLAPFVFMYHIKLYLEFIEIRDIYFDAKTIELQNKTYKKSYESLIFNCISSLHA